MMLGRGRLQGRDIAGQGSGLAATIPSSISCRPRSKMRSQCRLWKKGPASRTNGSVGIHVLGRHHLHRGRALGIAVGLVERGADNIIAENAELMRRSLGREPGLRGRSPIDPVQHRQALGRVHAGAGRGTGRTPGARRPMRRISRATNSSLSRNGRPSGGSGHPADRAIDHRVHQMRLGREVVVDAHRLAAQLLPELADRERGQALGLDQVKRRVDDAARRSIARAVSLPMPSAMVPPCLILHRMNLTYSVRIILTPYAVRVTCLHTLRCKVNPIKEIRNASLYLL